QGHPSLAYLFTGCYVGASSQAPRADESARDLQDLEMAFSFLESLPPGDHRQIISETLRHLQTDVTGNPHRSEICLDKFWNPGMPSGTLGLIEFRAIESLPKAAWMSAVALLWTALAARCLDRPAQGGLRQLTHVLHDRYFLPTLLWQDLEEILKDLKASGFPFRPSVYRDIWNWKFPRILQFQSGSARLEVRRAHESWPLLCEAPMDGGTTSRCVDTSMQRLEITANAAFAQRFEVRFANRPLELVPVEKGLFVAGLRYRRTNRSPSLHPGLLPQVPLHLDIIHEGKARRFTLGANHFLFRAAGGAEAEPPGPLCKSTRPGELTYDLRL
ncbi:MAG: transglutaminase family protein, partial [Phycisphaerae bacterium]